MKILMVCLGNICRSPVAEGIMIDKSKELDLDIVTEATEYLKKYSLKDVVELVSKKEKVSKKKVYEICLKIKKNEKNN